ncbi:hypothetical protein [Kushneria indalinina]|uniref:Uncharacterized protein n=1 Tax=Kushneria indalinina DSM 14324 TaxID=1122140 RepID=A0A3D9DSF4_9GAMM|nr:hypothetical protein [Kushneria indalinina]REC93334.1 hypothetical protein C8D72_3493 [Kushneria indalinina DSM 14324]
MNGSEQKEKFLVSAFYVAQDSRKRYETGLVSGLFGAEPKERTIHDPKAPDLDALAEQLQEQCNYYDQQGYDVFNIMPLNIGSHENLLSEKGQTVGHAGYSVTRGVMVVAKLKEPRK